MCIKFKTDPGSGCVRAPRRPPAVFFVHGAGPGLRSLSVLLKVKGVSERERELEALTHCRQRHAAHCGRKLARGHRGVVFFFVCFFFREDDKEDLGHW